MDSYKCYNRLREAVIEENSHKDRDDSGKQNT